MTWNRFCLVSMMLSFWATSAWSTLVVIENPSFEAPHVDPNAFQALPMVDQWIEQDNDVEYSANTGVFPNPDINSPGHLAHAHGKQLAFLGSEQGNSLEQVFGTGTSDFSTIKKPLALICFYLAQLLNGDTIFSSKGFSSLGGLAVIIIGKYLHGQAAALEFPRVNRSHGIAQGKAAVQVRTA